MMTMGGRPESRDSYMDNSEEHTIGADQLQRSEEACMYCSPDETTEEDNAKEVGSTVMVQ
jgi:hypothetical protein